MASIVDTELLRRLERARIPFCRIGASALAVHGYVRATADIDLLPTDARVLDEAFWEGAPVSVRRGDWDDPLAGSVIWPSAIRHDVVVGRGYAAAFALSTARENVPLGCKVPELTPLITCSGVALEPLGGVLNKLNQLAAASAFLVALASCTHAGPKEHWIELGTGASVAAQLNDRGQTVLWEKQGALLINSGAILTACIVKGLPATQQIVWAQRDPSTRDEARREEFFAWMARTAAELGDEMGVLQEVVVLRAGGPVYYHLAKFSKQEQPVAFEWTLTAEPEKGRIWTQVEVRRQAAPLQFEKAVR